MVFSTQNYWVFGLYPSSGILETRKYDVSETGSVSVLRWRGEKTPTQLGPLERETEIDPVSEMTSFLVSRIPDDGEGPKTQ
jgi:hypothetical protein